MPFPYKLPRLLFLVMMILRTIWQVIIRTWILVDWRVFSPITTGRFMLVTPINVNRTCMCKSSSRQWDSWPLKEIFFRDGQLSTRETLVNCSIQIFHVGKNRKTILIQQRICRAWKGEIIAHSFLFTFYYILDTITLHVINIAFFSYFHLFLLFSN